METQFPSGRVRFGAFEVDLRAGELRKHGIKIKLQDQPFQVLAILLEHPKEVVTREELRRKLWPTDTFVDFDIGLNSAVKKLRDALSDSAEAPRFVETLPRRGYRFIAAVETIASGPPQKLTVHAENAGSVPHRTLPMRDAAAQPRAAPGARRRAKLWTFAGAFAAILALFVGLNVGALRQRFLRSSGAERIRSVAVLPLENLTGDPGQEYFVDGMTDALITNLGRIESLRVISRTSVMRFKGTRKPLPDIARELGVDAVLEGTVLRSGDQVRIDAQLIHAPTDRQLWAGSYKRSLSDILALQGELAQAVTAEIAIRLTPLEQVRLAATRPVNPEVYQLYLKGRYFWNKRSEKGFVKAIEFFEQAIAIQPDYAQAYAGLSDAYALLGLAPNAEMSRTETMARARAAALRALEIDDTLAEAHASLASVSMIYDWNWPVAEKEFKRAIQLNPGYATAHHWYAFYCASQGRMEEALSEIRLAQQLDPLSLIINTDVGEILYLSRRYDEAIQQARKTLEMDPNFAWAHNWLGLAYLAKQRYPESIAELETAVRLSDGHPVLMAYLGVAYARVGRREEARQMLKQIRTGSSARYDSVLAIAWVLAALGERESSFAWAEKVYPTRPAEFYLLKVSPVVDPLRSDPRFQDLLHRIGLPP